MKRKLVWSVFWALVGIFVITISMTFIPLPGAFFTAGGVLALLGAVLLVLTVKTKVGGLLKMFFLLTGASAVGMPVFGILHNMVSLLLDTEEPVFFIMAVFVCPIGILIGTVGTIVAAIRGKQIQQT
jgi:hypothetical protein